MSTLRDKVNAPDCPVVFYELIPPTEGTNPASVEAYVECAAELVTSALIPVDAINLPEIRSEQRGVQRPHTHESKTDSRHFAQLLKSAFDQPPEFVINRCTVYDDWSQQQKWLQETRATFGIDNLVLVGGESSATRYPGPSVTEMARSIRHVYDHAVFCGGITIPTRRRATTNNVSHDDDEPVRLLKKARHGLEFFTTQVLYEPHSTQRLLKDYDRLCRQQGDFPRRILLSFAPAASRKDVDFLKWLGVEVPEAVEHALLKADIGIGWRSLKIASEILGSILDFVQAEGIQVPLGLNVEHITRHNFELSKQFIDQLGARYSASIKQIDQGSPQ